INYSKINRTYISNNKRLFQGILRDEWSYNDLVISDWFGTNSIVPSLKAGLDFEMSGLLMKQSQKLLNTIRLRYLKEGTIKKNFTRQESTLIPLGPKTLKRLSTGQSIKASYARLLRMGSFSSRTLTTFSL
ncbi:hypothetical protein TWF694_001579, partial [Orbilia ellipsospora]